MEVDDERVGRKRRRSLSVDSDDMEDIDGQGKSSGVSSSKKTRSMTPA
jgi:hypothetical protein